MSKIILTVVFVFLAFGNLVFGQKDSLAINLELGLRGRWQTGNLNQLVLNPNTKLLFSKQSFETEILGDFQYLRVEGFVAIKDLWITGIHKHRPDRKFFPMASALYGFAKSYKIDQSILLGAGAGLNLWSKSSINFLQVQLMGGYMNFEFDNENPISTATIGSIVQAAFPIGKSINLSWRLQSYHPLKEQSFWGINNDVFLFFRISKNLNLSVSHSDGESLRNTARIHHLNIENMGHLTF